MTDDERASTKAKNSSTKSVEQNKTRELFERYQGFDGAVLVHLEFPHESHQEDRVEFSELVRSAGAKELAFITGSRTAPDAKFFAGTGKVEEIREAVLVHHADVVIFNHPLTPAQERNLERVLQCRVMDRVRLILDIFAQRARTFEGKLQVELAQLRHMSTRLVRGWTHLERQKGGIGLRGPGETQLESDRRMIRHRIQVIQERLQKVREQRTQNRRARIRASLPTVAMVGYTNAGKSTLFNQLAHTHLYAADQLFATLDPTLRRIELPEVGPLILADTVGFIRHLPTQLIEAFKATLEEVTHAQLLLHVIDVSHPTYKQQIEQVEQILAHLSAMDIPQLHIYNKIDQCAFGGAKMRRDDHGQIEALFISAKEGLGIDLLEQAITEHLAAKSLYQDLTLSPAQGKLRAELYELGCVIEETVDEIGQIKLKLHIPQADWLRLLPRIKASSA